MNKSSKIIVALALTFGVVGVAFGIYGLAKPAPQDAVAYITVDGLPVKASPSNCYQTETRDISLGPAPAGPLGLIPCELSSE